MELRTNYQYTYFIYPFAIKEENYKKYILNLIKSKKYQIKLFDSFKDVELYQYFVPSIKEKMFQDFSFDRKKMNQFEKKSRRGKYKKLEEQNCLIFDYILEDQIQGKTDEKDGIFFVISQIELICFKTGICFLIFKTYLTETNKFSDILNFNHKFENICFENKNIKKLDHIKIQTDRFNNISKISEILEEITGQKVESRKLDIDDNLFLIYTYACLEADDWNQENSFENIENDFIKLAEVKPSNITINVDYEKLSTLANTSYMRMRINKKCVALICSSTAQENYTILAHKYENEYLYTYIIALHQKYYLKKLSRNFEDDTKTTIKKFINFTNTIWISEITEDSFGQKIYKRCKEKMNLEDMFHEVKNKYDIFYKKLNIEKNKKRNNIIIVFLICCIIIGIINYIRLMWH